MSSPTSARRSLVLIVLCFVVGVVGEQSVAAETTATKSDGVDAAVADLCQRNVVLLGEDANHGGGRTIGVKAALVQRLVDECGFTAVFFESQIYDFLDLARAFAQGTAQRAQLADAVGALWSTSAEADPLITFLFDRARRGQVRVEGLDPQVGGSTQLYTQKRLAAELASVLEAPVRASCESAFHRHLNWHYDDASPYDATAQAELLACGQHVLRRQTTHPAEVGETTRWMAANFVEYLQLSAESSAAASFNRRDRAMFRNLVQHLERLPRHSKVIVWCATLHAAKSLQGVRDDLVPLGAWVARTYGRRAASVGFSAAAGEFGRAGKPPVTLPAAEADSIEARALATSTTETVYLDQRGLRALSPGRARLLDYNKVESAEWARVLDAVVVLRKENPPQYIRGARPQQTEP